MKAILCAAFLASAVFTLPVQATTAVGLAALDLSAQGQVDRRSHNCDTPAQIAANSICRKP